MGKLLVTLCLLWSVAFAASHMRGRTFLPVEGPTGKTGKAGPTGAQVYHRPSDPTMRNGMCVE
jgi:hypothetical protein